MKGGQGGKMESWRGDGAEKSKNECYNNHLSLGDGGLW